MNIIDLKPENVDVIEQAAKLLIAGFDGAWPDMETAVSEIHDCLHPDYIVRIAVNYKGDVLGWIGGRPEYNGNVWELHPLVVKPDEQGKGIGRALVSDFEQQVRARKGITIYLGTDDESNRTTLGNVDLYPDVTPHIKNIKNLRRHPFEFYQKLGYTVVGVVPDANGLGKPDIMMAKRIYG